MTETNWCLMFHVKHFYNGLMENIRTYSMKQLNELVTSHGQPKFRAKQLYEWLNNKYALSYDEMSNLPASLRKELSLSHPLNSGQIVDRQQSLDGTRKYIVSYPDGKLVETVGIPSYDDKRLTVCVSTQVGCAMKCSFCATGREGFTRNLTAFEIVDQVALVSGDFEERVSNVVFMGQGEPFLNYENVKLALSILNEPNGFNIGARHMTVSTCGIIQGIHSFSQEPEQFTLAVSLHSAIQQKRDQLMPKVSNQPLPQLKTALLEYVKNTGRRVTLEYLLIKGVNDGDEDLAALTTFCEGLLCHVNLLPVNHIDGSPLKPSPPSVVNHWVRTLANHRVEATMRKSRGSDISGACGQLKNSR